MFEKVFLHSFVLIHSFSFVNQWKAIETQLDSEVESHRKTYILTWNLGHGQVIDHVDGRLY